MTDPPLSLLVLTHFIQRESLLIMTSLSRRIVDKSFFEGIERKWTEVGYLISTLELKISHANHQETNENTPIQDSEGCLSLSKTANVGDNFWV